MKKLCFALSLLMLFVCIVTACAGGGKEGKDTGTAGTGTAAVTTGSGTDTEPTETEDNYEDAVPKDLKYDGYTFRMAFPQPDDHGMDLQLIEEGNVISTIDTAIYNRNEIICDRFGIEFDGFCVGFSDTQYTFFAEALMGDPDAFDLGFIAFSFSGIPWITSGYAMPWNDVPYIDTDRAYWNSSMVENLSVSGKYFLLQGDINWPSMNSTQVCFFNTQVAQDNNVENLYELVDNGGWTFDKQLSIAKTISKDLNNDGKFDTTDQFGVAMCYYGAVYEIGIAANYFTVLADDEGKLKLNVDTDKFADIAQYAYDLIYSDGVTYIEKYDYAEDSEGIRIFFDDRALFMLTGLGTGEYFRNEQRDYGIIPWAKFDEKQDYYYSTNDQWGLSCSIPLTATNPERTGAITEALCALSGKMVYPTYYEKVLSVRNTRDEESRAMIDLIFDHIIYDPGICFGTHDVYVPLYKLVTDHSVDVSKWSARYAKKIQAQFDDLYAFVDENFSE